MAPTQNSLKPNRPFQTPAETPKIPAVQIPAPQNRENRAVRTAAVKTPLKGVGSLRSPKIRGNRAVQTAAGRKNPVNSRPTKNFP